MLLTLCRKKVPLGLYVVLCVNASAFRKCKSQVLQAKKCVWKNPWWDKFRKKCNLRKTTLFPSKAKVNIFIFFFRRDMGSEKKIHKTCISALRELCYHSNTHYLLHYFSFFSLLWKSVFERILLTKSPNKFALKPASE